MAQNLVYIKALGLIYLPEMKAKDIMMVFMGIILVLLSLTVNVGAII
jgi:hypothetical protein